jgi:hypothetical protein
MKRSSLLSTTIVHSLNSSSRTAARQLRTRERLKKFDKSCKEAQEFLMDDASNKELIDFQVTPPKRTERERNERTFGFHSGYLVFYVCSKDLEVEREFAGQVRRPRL